MKLADEIINIVNRHFAQTKEGIIQKEIAAKVAVSKGLRATDAASVQPNVSRALKALVGKKALIVTDKKEYFPPDASSGQKSKKREQVYKSVVFTDKEVFIVSESTILLSVQTDSLYMATTLLENYLGTERCFKITIFNNFLVVLLRGTSAELNQTVNDLKSIVAEAIEYQAKTQKKIPIKMKADSTEK